MRKKWMIITFIFILISQTLISGAGFPLEVKGEELEPSIFTNVSLTDAGGKIIDAKKHPDNLVNLDEAVNIHYQWSLADTDSFTVSLPSELSIKEDTEGILLTAGNIEAGSFFASTDGTVTMHFHENADEIADKGGVMTIPATFNKEIIAGSNEVSLTFPLVDKQQVIQVAFTPEAEQVTDEKIEKNTAAQAPDETQQKEEEKAQEITKSAETSDSGNQAADSTDIGVFAAQEITENILTGITVEVNTGTTDEPVWEDITHYSDPLGLGDEEMIRLSYDWALANGHGYTEGATYTFSLPEQFQVYNEVNGNLELDNGEIVGTFKLTEDRTVTMTFNDYMETHSNVSGILRFWTELREDLEGDTEQDLVFPIAGEEVKIPIRIQPQPGNTIEKKGIAYKNGEQNDYNADAIHWTIDANKQLDTIENAVLRDPIQTGQRLLPDTIEVYHLQVNINGSVNQGEPVDPSEYQIVYGENNASFEIQFKKPIDSAYRVVYDTEINNPEQTIFQNEAFLSGNNYEEISAGSTVTIRLGTPLAKEVKDYDQATQTISWRIKYNYNEKAIAAEDAVITDYFNDSQEFVAGSLEVYKVTIDKNGNEAGQELISPDQYDFSLLTDAENQKNGFKVQLKNNINA
ncbi:hypothetical protein J9303_12070, partial [Bacillaceae bacterium Marseille-Q3522]|nr:hypothetical protein [Bacillaceae bacterium Marseille-Q3522]